MLQSNTFKLVMLGEGRVGKTSLTVKYCFGQFNEDEPSTINASCLEKTVDINGHLEKMAIWDTAGQEMFTGMAPIYYRNAEGAIVVYDITIKETFEKVTELISDSVYLHLTVQVTKWISELREYAGKDIVIVLAGNKCDKGHQRDIDENEVREYCRKNRLSHFHTSAKSGKGITEMFEHVATRNEFLGEISFE